MPTYDYRCESCGEQFELRLKFSDDIDQPCKQCGEIATRQFSAVPIVFKGSGWYVNDYGKKGSSSGKQNDPSSSKKESSDNSSDNSSSTSEKSDSGASKSDSYSKPSSSTSSTSTKSTSSD